MACLNGKDKSMRVSLLDKHVFFEDFLTKNWRPVKKKFDQMLEVQ